MSVELIKKVIPFSDNDLEMNRRGQISLFQLQYLKDEVGRYFQFGVGAIIISFVLFVVAAIIFSKVEYKKPLIQHLDSLSPLLLGFFVLIFIIFSVGLIVVLWSVMRSNIYTGRLEVAMTEGKVERLTPGVDEYAYTVKVGAVDFYVDEKTHDAFTGDYYRVYYLNSSDILSVEEIKQTDVHLGVFERTKQ